MSARHDAATDRVSRTASAPGLPVTVLGWTCLRVDRNDFSSFCRAHSSGGGVTAWNVATGSSGETLCIFTPGGGTVVAPGPFVVGVWRPWAAVVRAASGTIHWIDPATGTVNSVTAALAATAPDGFTIGGRAPGDPNEWANVSNGFVRLITAELTAAQAVDEVFNRRGRHASLWADYPFDLASLLDESGHGRHLTAGTTALTADEDPPIGPPDRTMAVL